jgi:glucose-6-phosphate 1-dehydrogenase
MSGPRADTLVLFGITGDLARKLVLPALYRLAARDEVAVPIVGVARSRWTEDALHQHIRDAIAAAGPLDEAVLGKLLARTSLVRGDYDDAATYQKLAQHVSGASFLVHYLAVPPSLFATVTEGLASAGLATHARLVVEKPFGHDLASAGELNAELHRYFPEEGIFRVDHYLGKEPVQDLLILRFANLLFEPIWNRHHINSVQITMAETYDVADRGSFYDAVGTIRDVIQNHLLQVLAYLAMEPPSCALAEAERDEKVKLLTAVRTADPADLVRGQYTGYRDTRGVRPGSTTETYAAMRLFIDNWRWADVPFVIRAGKCLPVTALDVIVELHRPPAMLFASADADRPQPNLIRLRIQPNAGLTLHLLAKQPGAAELTREIPVSVDFSQALGSMQEAYEHVLAGAVEGDPRHFASEDTLEQAWRIVAPLLDRNDTPARYQPGSWGPLLADRLVPDWSWYPVGVRAGGPVLSTR